MVPPTDPSHWFLAIETTGPAGSVALGQADWPLEQRNLIQTRRHNLELLPTIDALLRNHGVTPAQLTAVFVSTGPGSFTGIRTGVTAAKTIAEFTGSAIVSVSTLDALAQNLRADHLQDAKQGRAGVCLNTKRDSVYAAVYAPPSSEVAPEKADGHWQAVTPPAVQTLAELYAAAEQQGLSLEVLLGDVLPPPPQPPHDGPQVRMLMGSDEPATVVQARHVYTLGYGLYVQGRRDDPLTLAPNYARRPEAVDLWEKRHPQPPEAAK